jgi:hypothetical protein
VAPRAIISYDDTPADHDALALGGLLGEAGAELTLAYVRHAAHVEYDRELLAEHEAEILLECGARRLHSPVVERRVVLSASTAEGLSWLARHDEAGVLVFGSDYRTPAGRVAVGRSTQPLLERGPVAIAIAPAAYTAMRSADIETIGILSGSADEAAIETAFSLAGRLGATVVDRNRGVDALIVGSRPEAPQGQVTLSSRSHNAIEEARCPVIVVARGVALRFDALVVA